MGAVKKLLGLAAAGAAANFGKRVVQSDNLFDSMRYTVGAGIAGDISYRYLKPEVPEKDPLNNTHYIVKTVKIR